jgi:hypothetical protein
MIQREPLLSSRPKRTPSASGRANVPQNFAGSLRVPSGLRQQPGAEYHPSGGDRANDSDRKAHRMPTLYAVGSSVPIYAAPTVYIGSPCGGPVATRRICLSDMLYVGTFVWFRKFFRKDVRKRKSIGPDCHALQRPGRHHSRDQCVQKGRGRGDIRDRQTIETCKGE